MTDRHSDRPAPRRKPTRARRKFPVLAGLALLVPLLVGGCASDQPSVFKNSATAAVSDDASRIPWDYKLVEGTVGDLIGSDMTILPDNALLPNDGNYATGDKIWTLQYMSADMTTNDSGRSEVKLSAWTPIKSYAKESSAKADIAELKVSLKTTVPLVGVYKTSYQGKTRNFAVLTLPSGNQIKQPVDDERYNQLKSLKKVPILIEEVHDFADYDSAYAKFRGWA